MTIQDFVSDEFVVMVRELEPPENGTSPDARVVVEQRASIPTSPVSPKTTRNLAIGLALGTLLVIGLAILRDMLDNTVKDRQTLEEITGVGLVGSIPLDKERRKNPAISFDSDNSPIAEAFRKLRTNLQFLAVDNPPRMLVVTSSLPGEGKTTAAINIALVEAEHSMVIIDGDMRRPKLDTYLDVVGSVGFSTVLAGRASLNDVLQKTRFPGLTVLTSGPTPPNPSELLGSLAAKKVLDELRAHFDYAVIDSSPLLAVTDAAILAASADGVLIIAQFGQTKREQLAHAVGNLADIGAPLLGAVSTMTPARGSSSYSYNYSYSYYGDRRAPPHSPESAANTVARDEVLVHQSGGAARTMNEIHPRRVSAVIRAYNEGMHIGRLLKGFEHQTVKLDEIILVDSGSTDDTVAIAEAAGCRIVHIAKSDFSFGRALNRGCAAASGDILLFTSAHVYPVYDTYVEHILSAFDRDGVAVAYGRQVGDERTKFSEARVMLKWFPAENIWDQGHPFSNNANAAVLKSVWQESPYDESLTGLEDLHFAKKALDRGHKIAYVADAPVVHVHEETWSVTRNRYRREAIAYARIVEGSKMSLPRALGLFLSNVAGDYLDAVRADRVRGNLLGIPLFRLAQFIGTWEGFRTRDHVSAQLRERFYYPAGSKSYHLPPAPGRKIVYSEDI